MDLARCLLTVMVLVSGPPAVASDWPRFHGPLGNGTSAETGLIKTWGEAGPPVLWSAELGPGFGGAAVRDGEVYLLDHELGEADILRCFDLESGEEKWSSRYEAPGRLVFPGSRTVPTVEEASVYTVGGFGQLTCFNRETHEIEWGLHLAEDLDGQMPAFGYSQMPIVLEDLLIVAPLGPEVGLMALDRFTGDEVWHTEGLGSTQSSPMLLELDGRLQLLVGTGPELGHGGAGGGGGRGGFFPGQRRGEEEGASPEGEDSVPGGARLTALDPMTGEELWTADPAASHSIVAPIKVDDHHFILTAQSSALFELRKKDGGYRIATVFESPGGASLHPPMLHNDHFFLISGGGVGGGRRSEEGPGDGSRTRGRGATGRLLCLDTDGKEVWRSGEDTEGYGTGNVLLADGALYIQDGYTGALRVVDPTPEGYQLLAEADLFQGKDARGDQQAWAPMALSDGRLLIRSQYRLLCVNLRAKKG